LVFVRQLVTRKQDTDKVAHSNVKAQKFGGVKIRALKWL